MRRVINRNVKTGLLLGLLALTVIISFLLIKVLKNPAGLEEKVPLYSYTNKTDVKYRVFLKPNVLYESSSLEEGEAYISEFIDHIKANFRYEFSGDKPIDIKGDYEVAAAVEGYTLIEDKVKVVWRKEFPISDKTSFGNTSDGIAIDKEVGFSISEYNSFASMISEAAKLNLSTRLMVYMNVNFNGIIEGEQVERKYTPTLMIPLSSNYFEIKKLGVDEKKESIDETKKIIVPVNGRMVKLCVFAILINTILLLYLLIFISSSGKESPIEKQVKKIFKLHGNRMVAINSQKDKIFDTYQKVNSIEDLVRIADELSKPIMYRYSVVQKDITKYYVYDNNSIYCYDIIDNLDFNGIDNMTAGYNNLNKNTSISK